MGSHGASFDRRARAAAQSRHRTIIGSTEPPSPRLLGFLGQQPIDGIDHLDSVIVPQAQPVQRDDQAPSYVRGHRLVAHLDVLAMSFTSTVS